MSTMSLGNKVSYTNTLDVLRNDLHRDVVQTASLMDITFDGYYEFTNPIEMVLSYYNNDRELRGKVVKIIGISWDGNIIGEDMEGKEVYLRYRDVSLENLDMMLLTLRRGEFQKSGVTLSI